jgi:4-aminobutyrate aminotransferase
MRPQIRVPLPGPKTRAIVERDAAALATTTKSAPVAAESGHGVWIRDVDGNELLDFTSGVGVTNTGYGNPRVLRAIRDQAEKLIHFAGTDYYYEEQVRYAERLGKVAPIASPSKVFFTNSGTESVEAAIKLARYHTRRPQYLGFLGAFHGRTMGSLAFTASKRVQRERYFPTMGGVVHVPYPNPYRNPWGIDGYDHPDELVNATMQYIESFVCDALVAPSEIAAILVEVVQGEGGYVVPPMSFFPRLARFAQDNGILLLFDEVQTGFGRTGKLFAAEHTGVRPDGMATAKAIASGIPMGAFVYRAPLDWGVSGAHSNTFGGNVLACAAANATLDALVEDGLVANAATVGGYLKGRLTDLQAKDERIGDVRGLGLMLAVEFVKGPRKDPDPKTRNAIVEEAYKSGLILLPCGKSGIRFIPPLSITREEAGVGADLFGEAMARTR